MKTSVETVVEYKIKCLTGVRMTLSLKRFVS